ncbi:MAG: XRE family transcriptional regulator [Actinobacteria bacterium]|nr:MAG: XRE family transcriptional regulator [Actinomycetota bacterium]
MARTPHLTDLGEFIREQREKSALSLRKLADQAGVSNPYLSQIERGLRRPSAEILKAIARALHIRTEALYERAGLLEGPIDDRQSVIEAIRADDQLTEAQKEALAEIYRSFASAEHQEGS